uniref:Cyclic nucleotide-binding domain-containing protein n=1 Tax=Trichobilharzia regenti TaxID=157069 RepID=A0AA85KJJ4_TRIRE|nr:unnamed protein product [Trichobilharzia regenti]
MEQRKSKGRKSKIPDGLKELLESLTFDVLKAQPEDILVYCIENLTRRLDERFQYNVNEAVEANKDDANRNYESELKADVAQLEDEEGKQDVNDYQNVEETPVSNVPINEDEEVEVKGDIEEVPDPDVSVVEGYFSDESIMDRESYVKRRQGVRGVSIDPEKTYNHEIVVHPKSDQQKEKLMQVVHEIHLLRCLDRDDHIELINAMFERKVEPGEEVIKFGEDGDNFYIIEDGDYEIYTMKDNQMQKIAEYKGKGSFGELALLYNTPRAATVRAITKGTLWAITRDTFHAIITAKAFKKRKLYESLLEKVDILSYLTPYERLNVADTLQTRIVEEGEAIFLQGQLGYEMYFIISGSVKVISRIMGNGNVDEKEEHQHHEQQEQEQEGEEIELCQLKENDYFGELALLTTKPRAASVYALERTCLAVLDVDSFHRLLGPCEKALKEKTQHYDEQRAYLWSKRRTSNA